MPISTNIPIILTPGVYIEIDNSRALGGLLVEQHKLLVLGQKVVAGVAAANVPVRVPSLSEAIRLFGDNSMLHHMFAALKAANEYVETWAIPLEDAGAGVAATGSILFAGPATASGTLNLYVGGERIQVPIVAGMTAAQIATATVAALTAATRRFVTAAVNGVTPAQVDLTAIHKGEAYNSIDLRVGYHGEPTPTGVTVTLTALSGGTSNPVLTTAIANFGPGKWHSIALPYTDATSLTAIEAELLNRYGPLLQLEGFAFSAASATLANLLTLGNGRNSPFVSILGMKASPTPPFITAAVYAVTAAAAAAIDPARPLQTLILPGVQSPAMADRFQRAERNQLLADGIATVTHDDDGLVRIERAVTTYQTAPGGSADPSYRDIETLRTLSFLRSDIRFLISTRYPRHKLASDGTRFGAGQAIVTPQLIKDELIARFGIWERVGLVEGREQFETALIVERDQSDTERVNALIPPDVINAFRVFAGNLQFRL